MVQKNIRTPRAQLILAFPDGEGARRADRVDYHERSEDCLFSSNEVRFKGVTLAPKREGGAESDEYSSSHAVKLRLYGFPQGAARFACFPLATARKWCQSSPRRGS